MIFSLQFIKGWDDESWYWCVKKDPGKERPERVLNISNIIWIGV